MVVQGEQKKKTLNQGTVIDFYKDIYSTMDLSNKAQTSAQGLLAAAASSMGALNFSQGDTFRGDSPLGGGRSGTNDSFPYGLSGVAMPNYGYPSDLYQFTSNGYPRKSRTCSYCGKVFTRSTTRRYHEKRCPLLRAAVCSMVPQEDTKKLGASTASDHSASWPLSSSLSESRKSGESKVVQSGKISNSLNKSLPPLMTPPFLMDRKYLKEMESAGYPGVIVKKEAQEHRTSQGSKLYDASSDLSSSHYMTEPRRSPHLKRSETRGHSVSPYSTSAGLDLSKSPSGASHDDASSVTHEDQYQRELIQEELQREHGKVENGRDVDTEKDLAANERMKRGERSTQPGQDDSDLMDINEPTSMPVSQDASLYSATNGENRIDSKEGVEGGETKCEICGKNFPSSWQLHVHKQIHTKFKPYACRFCGDRFSKAGLRITHERAHLGEVAFTCALCTISFNSKSSLQLHIKSQHAESPWTCKHCGETVEAQNDLISHLQSHSLTKEEQESLQYMPGAPGSGDYDDDSLEDGDEEQETMDSEALSDSIEASPEREVENLEQTPNSSGLADSDEPKEMCSICGHEFPASHMAFHMKVHEGQKPYSCPICGKRFGYKNNMKSHIKLHAGIKPYQCSICGAKFTRGSTLRRHARRHGISAESVWDLFVKNSASSQENMLPPTNGSNGTPLKNNSNSMPLHASPDERKEEVAPYADSAYNSFFNAPTSVAMSNALFMSYQNHQAAVAAAASSFPSIFNTSLPTSTSEIPLRSSAGFLETSHHTPQADALNLSIQKAEKIRSSESQENILSPPTSDEKPWAVTGSSVLRPSVTLAPGIKANSVDIGIQVNKCCKSSLEPLPEEVRSPSEASVHSDHSGSTYQQVSSSGLDNSTESISTLLATGRLYKCDHCECYFSEYAMYRIHSKLHARGGDQKPFACPVCDENCQDKTYFCMHIADHLR
ncbi:zinc finger and SCAN domain-containing protein 2-like [Saccostrea cucullata]|uniref:zinc finger and SCAN domain-containing protein 2-like n=1 Tax=Saccostrea cuccullata TaxID=36930 RepID=UPI002ED2DC27